MLRIALLPALACVIGAACGLGAAPPPEAQWVLPALLMAAVVAWWWRAGGTLVAIVSVGFALATALLASHARVAAIDSDLRDLLDAEVPGFKLDALRVEGTVPPVESRLRLLDDGAVIGDAVSLRAAVLSVNLNDEWKPVGHEEIRLTVGGTSASTLVDAARAGRTLTAPVVYRRPVRFLNAGVPDFEQDLVLDGTALLGSVKSGLLVSDVERGPPASEFAARVRAHVRRSVSTYVSGHDSVAGAVVAAVLIGDRTGLPEEIRTRLQAAGTYHVIAISGGNIAILAAATLAVLWPLGIRGRLAAALTMTVLAAYGAIVTSGPSVWRATLMAMLYLLARSLDHRTPPWHALAVVAAVLTMVAPLSIRDPGFILTFGATLALLEGGRLVNRVTADARGSPVAGAARAPRAFLIRWVIASVLASIAVELTLGPISAQLFSRVTAAGVPLNLVAVPAMAVVQIAGLVTCLPLPDLSLRAAGWIAAASAAILLESARLVDVLPALSRRVPPPGAVMLAAYYVSLVALWLGPRRLRVPAGIALVIVAACVASGWPARGARPPDLAASQLQLTMVDVGQAEAILLETPGGEPLLVDAGGVPFGGAQLDVGARVLAPVLWTAGVRKLGAVLVTHGDPDHIGGGLSVVRDFAPSRLWTGVHVPSHEPTRALDIEASSRGGRIEALRRGASRFWGAGIVRILHPPEPDWERQRVRNDDSVVLEVRFGDVAILLTGDISADVERELIPQLSAAPIRILKVAHHGSRTSTSAELLDAWRPHIALISCGRNNTFGHPAREVLQRLDAVGARIYRTDLDGQIVLTTDGKRVAMRTFTGRSDSL